LNQNQKTTVWGEHSNQWGQIGSPCRPSEEDGSLLLQLAAPALPAAKESAALVVMGVTPEIVQLDWPTQTWLQAFDHSADMIAKVWRPNPKVPSEVQQVRWQSMPLADHMVDCVVGDGSLTVIETLDEYGDVFSEVLRILRPGGSLVLRCFVSPKTNELCQNIVAHAMSGQIGSFHALKWRFAMAMSAEHNFSVRLGDVFAEFNRLFPDRDALALQAGWPRESIETINAFDGLEAAITFPALDLLRELCAPYFDLSDIRYGTYELAERCPTICFKPRNVG
jgi:SAM-dependent methyltransferase